MKAKEVLKLIEGIPTVEEVALNFARFLVARQEANPTRTMLKVWMEYNYKGFKPNEDFLEEVFNSYNKYIKVNR